MIFSVTLPHVLSVVTPVAGVGDYGEPDGSLDYDTPTPRVVRAFVQPVSGREAGTGADRQALDYEYVAFSNDTSFTRLDHVTFDGNTYEVTGIEMHYDLRGDAYAKVQLHRVEG